MKLNFTGIKRHIWFFSTFNDNGEFNLICLALKKLCALLWPSRMKKMASIKIMKNAERQMERQWDKRGITLWLYWNIVLLTDWWVSAVLRDFRLQVHLSASSSVSCFIVVLLSMPDSPNDNAAGCRAVVDGRGVNKSGPNHQPPLPPLLSPPPLSAGVDSPREIKPVCNPALPLYVCVFTTWPHWCCMRSVCGPRLTLLNQM